MPDFFPRPDEQWAPPVGIRAISYGGGNQDVSDINARGVYIGTAGHLAVVMVDGTTGTFSNLAAGTIYPMRIKQITQSGSTAAGLILY